MSKKKDSKVTQSSTKPELSKEELEAQEGEQLPDREQMSLVRSLMPTPNRATRSTRAT